MDNDSGQGHVDGGGEQGRSNQQQNRLDDVWAQSLRVAVRGGSSNVTDDFKETTHDEWNDGANASSGAVVGRSLDKGSDELGTSHKCGNGEKHNGHDGKNSRRHVLVRLPNVNVLILLCC